MVDEVVGDLGLGVRHLHLRPVGELRLGEHRDGRCEMPVVLLRVGQLVVELGLLDRSDALARGVVPEPAGDVTVDGFAEEAVLADVRPQHGHRNLPLTEAGNLDTGGEIGGGVLDGVMDVRTRDVHREPDLVIRQLLDLRRHQAIRPNGLSPAAR